MIDKQIMFCAEVIWEYMHMGHIIEKSDAILVCGSSDLSVANYAAEVFHRGVSDIIVCSGGFGKITKHIHTKTEAEVYATILQENNVPSAAIILEMEATNTGDNVAFSMNLLKKKKSTISCVTMVVKPYFERRAYATAKARFPDIEFLVTSPDVSFEEYVVPGLKKETIINLIVGDLQRIAQYPQQGYQIIQYIPKEVQEAYEYLVAQGFTQYLIK